MCPSQPRENLLEDILILLKFWQTMRSEKKHLMTSEVSDYDLNPTMQNLSVNKSNLDTASIAGSDVGRSSSTGTAGWYNTIPHSTSTLSKRSSRPKRPPYQKDAYDKDYMKKRNLILELLAIEIEFLITWYNPMASPENLIPGEDAVAEWRARPLKLNLWRDYTHLAWTYNPSLAIFLPQRIRNAETIEMEVARLVCLDPMAVAHIPEALKYLVTTKSLLADSPELSYMLTWSKVDPIQALAYFSRQYPTHPLTAQYAVKTLNSYPAEAVLPYIPQLVQALRHDTVSMID